MNAPVPNAPLALSAVWTLLAEETVRKMGAVVTVKPDTVPEIVMKPGVNMPFTIMAADESLRVRAGAFPVPV